MKTFEITKDEIKVFAINKYFPILNFYLEHGMITEFPSLEELPKVLESLRIMDLHKHYEMLKRIEVAFIYHDHKMVFTGNLNDYSYDNLVGEVMIIKIIQEGSDQQRSALCEREGNQISLSGTALIEMAKVCNIRHLYLLMKRNGGHGFYSNDKEQKGFWSTLALRKDPVFIDHLISNGNQLSSDAIVALRETIKAS